MTSSGRDNALARQLERYYVRFNDEFWTWFESTIQPLLPDAPTLVDVGSGPGLYLRDISARLPRAKLTGIDAAQEMIDSARGLEYVGAPPTMVLQDAAGGRLPLDDASVDLLTITAVLHTFNDPWAFLDEARRVLAPNGHLMVYDWVRVSMEDYIAQRQVEPGDAVDLRYPRALQLFSTHNKYTADDWRWVIGKAGFEIVAEVAPHVRARAFLAR